MQPIYIEVSDEITTVIERLKESNDTQVALVVPRGAILLQSLVNLKLARKAAVDLHKELSIVTTDKIGRNLAAQVGIPVFARLDEQNQPAEDAGSTSDGPEPSMIAGVKVHRYYDQNSVPEPEMDNTPAVEPIIPKTIMKEEQPAPVLEEESPIVIRAIATPDIPSPPKTIEPAPIQEPIAPPPTEPPAAAASLAPPPRNRRKLWAFVLYLFILLFLGAGAVSAVYLPKTTVTLTIKPEHLQQELVTTAKASQKEATSNNQTIPAEVITVQSADSVTIASTGKKETGDSAKGTAQVFNSYSGNPQPLPAGSKISANGLTFSTQNDVSVPGAQVQAGQLVAGSALVNVTADQPGPDSNLSNKPGTVLAQGTNLYAQIVSTTGGTSKVVAVVTQTDIANAKESIIKKLTDASRAKLSDQLKNRDIYSEEKTDFFSLDSFTPSVEAGTLADSVQGKGSSTLKRFVVDKGQLQQALNQRLQSGLKADTTFILDTITVSKMEVKLADQSATLTAQVSGRLSPIVPTDSLRTQLIGKTVSAGEDLLGLIVKNARVDVSQSPSWWPIHRFPFSPRYLSVEVHYE